MEPSNPVVKRFVAALNSGDREAFLSVLRPAVTMSRFELRGERIVRFETAQA